MARVIYKAAAETEIGDAYRDYESERQDRGGDFLDELARIQGHLEANPALYQRVDGDMRAAVLRRFSYGLFYVVEGAQVNVLARLHLQREPRSREELLER